MTEPAAAAQIDSRSFTTFLAAVEEGRLHTDLTAELHKALDALHEHYRSGKVKAALTVELSFTYDGDFVEVRGDVKSKLPKHERSRSVFWLTRDNQLSRRNPNQMDLPLRDVAVAPAEVRTV